MEENILRAPSVHGSRRHQTSITCFRFSSQRVRLMCILCVSHTCTLRGSCDIRMRSQAEILSVKTLSCSQEALARMLTHCFRVPIIIFSVQIDTKVHTSRHSRALSFFEASKTNTYGYFTYVFHIRESVYRKQDGTAIYAKEQHICITRVPSSPSWIPQRSHFGFITCDQAITLL